jgi:hypothetical protein
MEAPATRRNEPCEQTGNSQRAWHLTEAGLIYQFSVDEGFC